MDGLGPIVLGIGSQDGLNACIFMTCAIFILLGFWFKNSSWSVFWLRVVFALVYALCFLAFNFGPGQVLILQRGFIFFAKIFYFISGLGAFVLGVLSLKDWFLIKRGRFAEDLTDKKTKPFPGFVACVVTIILAVVLSAASTLWPINTYFMILGNAAIQRADWHMVISLLISYVVVCMWPLWFVWAFLSIKLRPSWFKIFCASIFFIASTTVIFIFKISV